MSRSTKHTLRKQAWEGRGVPVVAKHTAFIYTPDDDGKPASSPLPVTRNIPIGSKIDTRTSESRGPSKRALKRAARKREMQRRGHKPSAEAGEDTKPASRSVDSLSSLERTPTELLLCISDYLQPHTVASLALASRALLFRLGTKALSKLDAACRLQVMDAIQRDHAELVLCYECHKLHSPWLSLGPQTPEQPRFPCQNHAAVFEYTTFHRRLNSTVVDNWMRKSNDPTVLLKQLRQTRTVARKMRQETFYIQRSERPLLTPRFLVAKAQTVIVPASGDWNNRTVVGELLALINTLEDYICPHKRWEEAVPGSLGRPGEQRPQRRLRWGCDGKRFTCLLSHERGCRCRDNGSRTWWEAPPLMRPGTCDRCCTDFLMTVAEFPGLRTRALVLATWNVVAARPNDSSAWHQPGRETWYPHGTSRYIFAPPLELDRMPMSYVLWSGGFQQFEENHAVGRVGNYRPWMTPLDIGRLTDFGHRLEVEDPSCGLPHRTGPDHRILHPDPEEEPIVSTLETVF